MRRHETWIALLLLIAVGCGVDGLRGSELVLAAKAKAAEEKLNPTTESVTVVVNEDGSNSTVVKPVSLLTGIPQKDYIYDPNLPRELKGYNLTDYPFYNSIPKNIEFECDGLHDGFYASVPHSCQVYHHCLFGTRYDFLCANYTAFDQTTFICHFVSEVDCKNSPKYYKRNEALYKAATTAAPSTTRATTTTTTTTTTTEAPPKKGGRRRRPYRRRRPVYDYYYDDEDEAYDEEYYDDDVDLPPPRKANRRQQRPSGGKRDDPTTTTSTTTSTTTAAPTTYDGPLTRAPLSVYAPRALPKIKRPVPLNEKSKYDYTTKAGAGPAPTSNPKDGEDEEYYDDDEEYDEPQPPPSKRKESGKNGRRRSQHSERKRPMRYEDEYEDEEEDEEDRPRLRKGNNRKDDDFRSRNRGSQGKSKKGQREEEEPIPSERPGYISPARGASRKRYPESSRPERRRPDRRPAKGFDYYDEEDPEEDVSRYSDERRRPNSRSKADKQRARPKKPTTTSTTTTSTTTSTTTTTTTTPRPTSAPTTPPPASYEDEEYEEYEYEDDIILDKPKDENRKTVPPTTPAPHRFSTSAYRTQRLPSPAPTTTEQSVKRGTPAPTFRSRKPDYRRPPSSDETFSSHVGTPTGFKRPEEDNSKVKSSEQNNRGSYEDDSQRVRVSEFPSRRPVTGTGSSFSSEDFASRRQVKPESSQPPVEPKPPTTRQEYPIPPAEVKTQGDSQGFFIRKPFKPQINSFSSKYTDDSSQRRPDSYNVPVSSPSSPAAEDDLPYRKQQQGDPNLSQSDETSRAEEKKTRIEYPVPPPQITQGPPLPSPPQSSSIYRRPYVPTGPEGPRRSNDESQFRRQKPESFPPSGDGNLRRPFLSSVEGGGNKEDEQSYRRQQKPSYTPTGPDAFRRPSGPEGTIKSSLNYRRTRPEKEPKKTLEELAYPSRRPGSTQAESVTEPGPNYRNPFLSARPVVEEPDYYKNSKEPALDFTAPGPGNDGSIRNDGPIRNDGSTQRPLPPYDIGEEYDVTLNDALQPSTLNPTVQYSRVKTRGYQSAVTHPSYRSILIPAASQNYYSKTAVADQMEYESVVLPTARFTQAQARYKTPRRPNDWSYW